MTLNYRDIPVSGISAFDLPRRPKLRTYEGKPALYVQAKYDGIMVTVYNSPRDGVQAYSRHANPTKGLLTAKVKDTTWFGQCENNLNIGESLMGELWCPDQPASAVKSDCQGCRFSVFAVPHFNDNVGLPSLQGYVERMGLHFPSWWEYCTARNRTDCHKVWDLGDPRSANPNYEGFVFKDGNLLNWAKHKPSPTIDLVVTEVNMAIGGKHSGRIGSFTVRTTEGHVICDVGTGLKDPQRRLRPADCLGRVVEVGYQYISSKGSLRHPRFLGFRDDKTADECSITQDLDLAFYHKKPLV